MCKVKSTTIYMLANKPLKFQKGIGWVAQVKPEMGRKVSPEIVNGKSPPVIQENLHALSKALARKSAIWEWSWEEHLNYLPE